MISSGSEIALILPNFDTEMLLLQTVNLSLIALDIE